MGPIDAETDLPLGTAISWQLACGPSNTGPWSTALMWIPGDIVPHECDGVAFVQVTASLSTTDATETPSVLDVRVEYDLIREPDAIAPFDLTTLGQTWLWRVHDHSSFYASELTDISATSPTSSGDYALILVDGTMNDSSQVIASGGGTADGGGADVTLDVSSIRADVTVLPTAIDDHRWELTSGPAVSRIVRLS